MASSFIINNPYGRFVQTWNTIIQLEIVDKRVDIHVEKLRLLQCEDLIQNESFEFENSNYWSHIGLLDLELVGNDKANGTSKSLAYNIAYAGGDKYIGLG